MIKQYNPDIIGIDLRWKENAVKELNRRIHLSVQKFWIKEKDYEIVSTTLNNLFYWLIPTFSPLYKNWQLCIWSNSEFQSSKEIEKLNLLKEYLSIIKWNIFDLNRFENKVTLISQFSWLMIRDIINWNTSCNEYILWKLFRKWWQSKINEYYQLESVLIDYNIKHIIDLLESLLFNITGEKYTFYKIKEKSFPFVSPWFEFTFINWSHNEIKFVGWYVDNELLSKFWITKNYFIFWINTNKFLISWNEDNKKRWSRKNIAIDNVQPKMLESTSDINQVNDNSIAIQPNKIEYLLKERLYKFLWCNDDKSQINSDISIEWNRLRIIWNWKNDFFENIPDYLEFYYWWKIIVNSNEELVIEFENFNLQNLWKTFSYENEYENISFTKYDLKTFLWIEVNLLDLESEFNRIWCKIELNNNWYLIKVPKYKQNISFKSIIWEIIFYIFRKYDSVNDLSINLSNLNFDWLKQKLNFLVPQFLISNGFNELNLLNIWNINDDYSTPNESTINWSNLKLNNWFINWVINYIKNHSGKLPGKWFSIEKVQNWYKLIYYINSNTQDYWINNIYNYMVTIFNMLWINIPKLNINNSLNFLEQWQSFSIINSNWDNIWYLWKYNNNGKIKWDIYLCEFLLLT